MTAQTRAPDRTRPGASLRTVTRRSVTAVALVALGLLIALLMGLAATRDRAPVATDPEGTDATGSRALARVLDAQGVRVTVARSVAQTGQTQVGSDTTVLLSRPDRLPRQDVARLAQVTRSAGRLVLIGPDTPTLEALGVPARLADRTPDDLRGGCPGPSSQPPDVEAGWRVSGPAELYEPVPAPGGASDAAVGCLAEKADDLGPGDPTDETAPAGPVTRFGYLRLPRTSALPQIVLLGTDTVLLNETATEADNAAVALRTLGRHPRLVWLLPDPRVTEEGGPVIYPGWLGPAVFALAGAVVGLCLWRGRRLGRLAVEPLPVVVPAGETVLARARLYQRSGEPDRALAILQNATAVRLAHLLRLPRAGPVEDVVIAAAARTGRPVEDVRTLLTPAGDRRTGESDLVRAAQELRRLESEVGHA